MTTGLYRRAVWLDYDHDYDLDLFLLGEKSALFRNNGSRGFSNETAHFPFMSGRALDGIAFGLVADTAGVDLVVAYADRGGVVYRDKLAGHYQPEPLEALSAGTTSLTAHDVNEDGWIDLAGASSPGLTLLLNHKGKLERAEVPAAARGPIAFGEFDNRGLSDLVANGTVYSNRDARLVASRAGRPDAVAVATADFAGEGKMDLAAIAPDGTLPCWDT